MPGQAGSPFLCGGNGLAEGMFFKGDSSAGKGATTEELEMIWRRGVETVVMETCDR